MTDPTTSGMRFLRTKMMPPRAPDDLVERDRLLRRLDEGARRKLILVSAPAGFGKTTLLSTWLAHSHHPTAWVSLDERDNDPRRFWGYVLAALQSAVPGVGATTALMLEAPQPPPLESALVELLNDLAMLKEEVVLILDDYHVIEAPAIHEGIAFLLENLPPQAHLVLAGRVDPPLPLSLLRARNRLVELGPADLSFTRDEVEAFFKRLDGLDLAAEDVAALEARTEGWAAGLQLAALSISELGSMTALLDSFTGGHRYVFDYLAQEILERQPPRVSDFLLRTAILDRMSASLCDALLDDLPPGEGTGFEDAAAILTYLDRANLFLVPLDEARRWYRYHHLFGDFLRVRLEDDLETAEIAHLHKRASAWFAAHDDPEAAIEHALTAGDYDRAAQLLEGLLMELFQHSELLKLTGWLARLPEAWMDHQPRLNMAAAWALLALGRSEEAEARLEAVERHLGQVVGAPVDSLTLQERGALAEIATIRSSLAFNRMDLQRVRALCRQVRTYLGDEVEGTLFNTRDDLLGVTVFNLALVHEYSGETDAAVEAFKEAVERTEARGNLHLLPLASSHLAQLQILRGELRAASATYRRALLLARRLEHPSPLAGLAHAGMGNLLYEWDELEAAEEHLALGVEMGRLWLQWEILLSGYVGLARLRLAQGDRAGALAEVDRLAESAEALQILWARPAVETERALLLARAGDVEATGRWLRHSALDAAADFGYFQEPTMFVLARVLVVQGRVEEALALLQRLITQAEEGGRRGRVIELSVVRAQALLAVGQEDEARTALERALLLAEPEGYVRTFVDEPALTPLLRRLAEGGGDVAGYARHLLEEMAPPPALADRTPDREAPAQDLVEPLSERELEVLALLAAGLTNQEAAERLFISVNTVKTHVKHVYDKLNVRNRAEAVARAAELGLLY
ncbi:MAG: LuxR C-terminal-related transcriptional regulator [Anaerolineales bacterium]